MESRKCELIVYVDPNLARYEKLYFEKARLEQEIGQIESRYLRIFGRNLVALQQAKLEILLKRREIELYRQAFSRGLVPDDEQIQAVILELRTEMESHLQMLGEAARAARKAKRITPAEETEIRAIYRRLVRRLHPDLNSDFAQSEELRELWLKAQKAYQAMDLKTLRQTELLLESRNLLSDACSICQEDLEAEIKRIEQEIRTLENDPAFEKVPLMQDKQSVAAHKENQEKELEELEQYLELLEGSLERLIERETSTPWPMN